MIVLEVLSAIFFICLGALISACEAIAAGLRRLRSRSEQRSDATAGREPEPVPTAEPGSSSNNATASGGPAPDAQPDPAPSATNQSAPGASLSASGSEGHQESATMTTTTPVSKLTCKTAASTDVGRVRAHNEDNFFIADDEQVVAVADGMGCHASGEVASAMVTRTFSRDLRAGATQTWSSEDEVKGALLSAISGANDDIKAHAFANRHCSGMGTTVVAMAYLMEEVHIAHVGDSRAYRLRGGQLEQLTSDHSLVNKLIQQGTLNPEDVESFIHKNIITRALGEKNSTADHCRFSPRKGDIVLLCSDGLNGEVSDGRIAEILRAADEGNLQGTGDQLIAEALKHGGRDNVTVVLVMFVCPRTGSLTS